MPILCGVLSKRRKVTALESNGRPTSYWPIPWVSTADIGPYADAEINGSL
ncbi:hypothetical protein FOXB_17586 [Fusarium oxysporum f. sp. conglutinans Fo5176]|uniref:Uncharacterized protein n=1 Tax=Fusarium oxysporum (strain Fo5176) TaxID=660025 RepID=F9GG02_FUSOF|nr:hypothetical protein FOXB_17586 [Fusarium oxysporum f. sp. conglutinans Fo5176]